MRLVYQRHSGFSVEAEGVDILIDYIGGIYEKGEKPVIALVSHAHGDHRKPEMISFADKVIDCPGVGEEFELMGVKIRTYGSTDEGVSFMIEVGGKKLFHAGDFNLWHWKAEGDPAWTMQATADFWQIMDSLEGAKPDAVMFPVDPRMGAEYDEGACIFNERMQPGIFIPMHFWEQPEAAEEFAKKYENVRALTKSGQYVEI